MFDRLFDRRVHFFLLILFGSGAVGVPFGFYALWPANIERGYEPVQPIAFRHALHAGKGILPEGKLALAIDCRYCHCDVETGPAATVPPVSTCMNCHSQVQPKVLPIPGDQRLQAYMAEQLAWWRQTGAPPSSVGETDESPPAGHEPSAATNAGGDPNSDEPVLQVDIAKLLWHWEHQIPIRWVKVHDLADFVYFDHSRHLASDLGPPTQNPALGTPIPCADCHGAIENMTRVRRVNSLKMAWCLDCHRKAPTVNTIDPYREAGQRGPTHCSACHR
jgi:hypothetical protein